MGERATRREHARILKRAPHAALGRAWAAAPLKRLSKHHKTGAPLPDDLIARLVASRNANGGAPRSMSGHAPAKRPCCVGSRVRARRRLLRHPPLCPPLPPAILNSRQLAYGIFDQAIHTSANASSREAYDA